MWRGSLWQAVLKSLGETDCAMALTEAVTPRGSRSEAVNTGSSGVSSSASNLVFQYDREIRLLLPTLHHDRHACSDRAVTKLAPRFRQGSRLSRTPVDFRYD